MCGASQIFADVLSGVMRQQFRSAIRLLSVCSEIISRVRAGEAPAFRPRVEREDCDRQLYALMERCWAQQPAERPSFADVSKDIRSLTK